MMMMMMKTQVMYFIVKDEYAYGKSAVLRGKSATQAIQSGKLRRNQWPKLDAPNI